MRNTASFESAVDSADEIERERLAEIIMEAAGLGFREGWAACNAAWEARFIATGSPEAARIVREVAEAEAAQFEAAEMCAAGGSLQ